MTDNIFEIGTSAFAQVACAPRESGVLLTDFAAAYSSVIHSWIFCVLDRTELPEFICRFLRRIYCDSTKNVEFAGTTPRTVPHGQGSQTRMSSERLLVCDGFRPLSSVGSRTRSFQGTFVLTTLQWLLHPIGT